MMVACMFVHDSTCHNLFVLASSYSIILIFYMISICFIFNQSLLLHTKVLYYHILPIKRTSPNKSGSLRQVSTVMNQQNSHSFLRICPIFNLKPPLASSESYDFANMPSVHIRKDMVSSRFKYFNFIMFVTAQEIAGLLSFYETGNECKQS